MTWYEERRLGWEMDTWDRPETWTLKRLHERSAEAEKALRAQFRAESVPFPAGSLGDLTLSDLREVTEVFGEEEQWTYICTVKAFYHLNRTLLDASTEHGTWGLLNPREVLNRISEFGPHQALILALLMRAHFIAVPYKARTDNEEGLADQAKDVEKTGAELIASIDHVGQTLTSRYHAEKFSYTEGLVGWATEVGLLDLLATLRERIQVMTDRSAAAWQQRQKHHRALEPQEGNLPDTFYAAFDKVAHLLRPGGRGRRRVKEAMELFSLIGHEVNMANENRLWTRRKAKRSAESAYQGDVDEQ